MYFHFNVLRDHYFVEWGHPKYSDACQHGTVALSAATAPLLSSTHALAITINLCDAFLWGGVFLKLLMAFICAILITCSNITLPAVRRGQGLSLIMIADYFLLNIHYMYLRFK